MDWGEGVVMVLMAGGMLFWMAAIFMIGSYLWNGALRAERDGLLAENLQCTSHLVRVSQQYQEQIAALEAELAAERERNAPLRARIKKAQDQHDRDTRAMRKRLAYFDDLWHRAREAMQTEPAPGWVSLPSAWERAQFGVLVEDRDALADRVRELEAHLRYFVRYWWEQHQPDERDITMARARLEDPEIHRILTELSPATAAEGQPDGR